MVDILDIIGGGLEVASGIVALGNEDVVLGTIRGGLINGNRSTLVRVRKCGNKVKYEASTHHELLLDLA